MQPHIAIYGLRDIKASMRVFPPKVRREFDAELRGLAQEVVDLAKTKIAAQVSDRSTGNAADSIRITTSATSVYIKAGGEQAKYFPWLDFGGVLHPAGDRHNTEDRPRKKGGRFLYRAIAQLRPKLSDAAHAAADRAKRSIWQ